MSTPKAATARALAALPQWAGVTVSRDESYRFEALTLLESAATRLGEIEAKPPADGPGVSVAVLHPMHLTVKALLAARGFKSSSTRATVDLLGLLYADQLPAARIADFIGVQSLTIQGTKAIEAAKSLLTTAKSLLATGG